MRKPSQWWEMQFVINPNSDRELGLVVRTEVIDQKWRPRLNILSNTAVIHFPIKIYPERASLPERLFEIPIWPKHKEKNT